MSRATLLFVLALALGLVAIGSWWWLVIAKSRNPTGAALAQALEGKWECTPRIVRELLPNSKMTHWAIWPGGEKLGLKGDWSVRDDILTTTDMNPAMQSSWQVLAVEPLRVKVRRMAEQGSVEEQEWMRVKEE